MRGLKGNVAILCVCLATVSCDQGVEKDALAQAPGPQTKVKVARPLVETLPDVSQHTGRAQAVDSVEIRARVSGYLQKVAFREGDRVAKGELLFVVDPRPAQSALALAEAALEQARVDEDLAKREDLRAARLLDSAVIAERERDERQSTKLAAAASSKGAAAAVASARLELEYCFIRAPVAGRIGRIAVTPGNLIGPTTPTPLTTVVSTDPLYVYVDVEETQAIALAHAVAAGATAARVGFGDETGYPHQATVDFLDNHIEQQTGTRQVRVVIHNPGDGVTPGAFARVQLNLSQAHEMVLIADRAVGTDQDRRFVLVVVQSGSVERRDVKLGPLRDGLRVVTNGLIPSDQVIVAGLQRVRVGMHVVAEPSELEPSGTRGASGHAVGARP